MEKKVSLSGAIVEGHFAREPEEVVRFSDLNTDYFTHHGTADKAQSPKATGTARRRYTEVCRPNRPSRKPERCFSCGLCDECDNCYLFCPDSSVVKQENDEAARL